MIDIVEQLRFVRQQQGMKQAELGEKLGLPQSHVSKIEQGANDPRLSTVVEMGRVLDQELVLIPRQMVSAVRAFLKGEGQDERRFQADEGEDA
jgi:transcriptional regulator with XRE-family HTH domain